MSSLSRDAVSLNLARFRRESTIDDKMELRAARAIYKNRSLFAQQGEALRGFVRHPAMFRHRLDQHSDQRRGKIMAHAFDHHEFGAWYVSGGILAAFGQGQRIFCSMNDQGRPADALEELHPAAVRQDG